MRKIVGGVQEGSQTPRSGVEPDPGLPTTLPRLRGRSGGVLVPEDRAAGVPTQENLTQLGANLGRGGSGEEWDRLTRGLSPPPWFGPRSERPGGALQQEERGRVELTQEDTKVTSPVLGPTQSRQRSGGALGESDRTVPTPHSPESTAIEIESELRPRRLGRTAKGSPAGGMPGQPSTGALTFLSPSGGTPGAISHPSVKRRATVQGDTSLEFGEAPRAEEEGKRPRRSVGKDNPRRTLARKAAERLRKTKDTDKHLPRARRTGNLLPKGSALQGEGVEATGEVEMELKWDLISETQNAPEVTSSDLSPREYKDCSPLLPRTPRHIEWRRRLGQNPVFLPALERALIKARKELVTHTQDLEEDPSTREDKGKAVWRHHIVWLLEDSIHRVKSGTYHLR